MRKGKIMSKFKPDYISRSLSGVKAEILKSRGISVLLLDLDNTLAPWRTQEFSADALKWLQSARQDFEIYILSNGSEDRVAHTAAALKIKYIAGAHKPNKKKLLRALAENKINPERAAVIGDQLYTDVLSAVRLGACSVLLTPISGREYIFTKFNRLREYIPRRRIYKRMKYMEELYD